MGEGRTVTFWGDLWSNSILENAYPVLFSFAKNKKASVHEVMNAEDLDSLFHLPLSEPAWEEMLNLQQLLIIMPYREDSLDEWTFIWGNQTYTSRRYYRYVYENLQVPRIFKILWSSKCTQRIKFFTWLLLVDRLNTKTMLLRRHFHVQPNAHCIMCNNSSEEDIDHLFFTCPLAVSCWNSLSIQWSLAPSICDRILSAIHNHSLPLFMEIFMIAAWELWNLRNSKIFDNGRATRSLWMHNFKAQAHLQLLRVREIDKPAIVQWLDTLV